MKLPDFDLYLELEVAESASTETIEAAYRSLAKRTHPDIVGSGLDAGRMVRLNVAHEWLVDPVRRSEYDRLRTQRPGNLRVRSEREPGVMGKAVSTAPAPATRPASGWESSPPGRRPVRPPTARTPPVRSLQDRIRDLTSSSDPWGHVQREIPPWQVGAAALYTVIFMGAAIGLASEVVAGQRSLWDHSLVFAILVGLVVGGLVLLAWSLYMYSVALRLRHEKKRRGK